MDMAIMITKLESPCWISSEETEFMFKEQNLKLERFLFDTV